MAAFAGDSAWPMSQFPPWSRDTRRGFKTNDGRPNFQRMVQKCCVSLPLQSPPYRHSLQCYLPLQPPNTNTHYTVFCSGFCSRLGGDTMQNYLVVWIFPSFPLNLYLWISLHPFYSFSWTQNVQDLSFLRLLLLKSTCNWKTIKLQNSQNSLMMLIYHLNNAYVGGGSLIWLS